MIRTVETYNGNPVETLYAVRTTIDHWDSIHRKIRDWCLDNFGVDHQNNWYCNIHGDTFYFTKEDDMLLFILRWS